MCLRGIKEYELILNHLPEEIEESLGDGSRWGVKINYHLLKYADYPFSVLAPISRGWSKEKSILLAQGDILPSLPTTIDENSSFFLYDLNNKWTGWGILPVTSLSDINVKQELKDLPTLFPKIEKLKGEVILSTQKLEDLKKSNESMIKSRSDAFLFPSSVKKIQEGVWVSSNTTIGQDVKINPPVFISDNCQIKGQVQLGPNVIIEKNCFIDSRSNIENALICKNSYVGENLHVNNCIIDKNLLINITLGTTINIQDDFILSESKPPPFNHYLTGFTEIFLASFLLAIMSPIFFVMWCFFSIVSEEKILLPAPMDEDHWKTFKMYTFNFKKGFFRRLPTLLNIIRQDMHFVGLSPRGVAEVKKLPKDWRNLILKSKVGVMTLVETVLPKNAKPDDIYASEVFYSVQYSFWYDLKLFFKWLLRRIW